jgi:hypothetical protein
MLADPRLETRSPGRCDDGAIVCVGPRVGTEDGQRPASGRMAGLSYAPVLQVDNRLVATARSRGAW